jgi:excisionase family DNA binding protein
MDDATPRKLLTPQQLAELTGLSLSTLAKLRLTSNGPPFQKFGAAVRYPEEDVSRWIDSHPRRRSTSDRVLEPSAA